MSRTEKVILMNMCMIYDDFGNVLIEDKLSKKWGGITFPGGHIEKDESFVDSIIREVYEETGLTIKNPVLCGTKQWIHEDEDIRNVVLCYKTNVFSGDIVSSDEGEVRWVKIKDLPSMNLAKGMDMMFKVFFEDEFSEHYLYIEKDGTWKQCLK